MMLTGLCSSALRKTPDKTAIVFNGRSLTYAELHETVGRYAAAVASLGIGHGDRVALFYG